MKKIKEIVSTKVFKLVFLLVAGLLIILLVFAAGIKVGLKKARYSYQWGANYERNFLGPHSDMMDPRRPNGKMRPSGPMDFFKNNERDMRNANGLAGAVVSFTNNLIVVKDKDNKESTVAVNEKTIIKFGRSDIEIGDLKVDQQLVVLGKPNDAGMVDAELIRVFDSKN